VTTQLPERLRDLADEAPGPLSASGLWQEGRRRHRRRIMTAATVVGAIVAITAGAGYGDWRSRQPDPAAPPATYSGPMAIPDRFYEPSPWLPSTSTPGRLVAIMPDVEQHHVIGGPSPGVVGIAAGSQRYSFLDLPDLDRVFGNSVALAPDGLHIAYVYDGPVPDSPTKESNAYGVAVLDLTTGKLSRHAVSAPYGINNVAFRWATRSRLMVSVSARHDAPNGHLAGIYRGPDLNCDIADDACRASPRGVWAWDDDTVNGGSGYAHLEGAHQVVVDDPATGARQASFHVDRVLYYGGALTADRTRLTGLVRNGRVALHHIPGTRRYFDVVGMRDPRHVLAVHNWKWDGAELRSVDVVTGRTATVSRFKVPTEIAGDAVASGDVVASVPPPRPWNKRALVLTVLATLVTLAAMVWLDSRRRRRVRR
jgi:hypothetical protein